MSGGKLFEGFRVLGLGFRVLGLGYEILCHASFDSACRSMKRWAFGCFGGKASAFEN